MFNRSEIMKAAWAGAKAEIARNDTPLSVGSRRFIFKHHLKAAWAAAKRAARPVETGRAAELRQRLYVLDCKTRWTPADYAAADAMRAEIQQAA